MNPHILVVDDEAPIREMLSLFFKKRGCQVTAAMTAREGLEQVKLTAFDVVILDINLTDGSGLDLLEPIKAARPNLPVIVLTGVGLDERTRQKAMQLGARGYLFKTQPLDEVWQEVRRVLGYGL